MSTKTTDGLFVLVVLIVALVIVYSQLKFAAPVWAAQALVEKCHEDVIDQYEVEKKLVLRSDLSGWSKYKLRKDIEYRRRASLRECEEYYGGKSQVYNQK